MNRAAYYNYIEERIVTLCTRVELRGKINILDYHLHSENFYRDLFNKLFAWNLENLNSEIQNVEAIDLIDKSNNIAIQVSATNTKSKIDNALRLESNLSSIINLLSKKDFTSIERNTKINSFEIERKIDFNKLDTSKEIIEEYKLYHHIVDKIYAEFDKSGCNKSISVLNTITTMLLPDNIHPKNSIYYNGAIVLELVQQYQCIELTELYILVKKKKNMSYPILVLCLDWLYLLNAAIMNEKGEVCLCS